ncbi:MAG: hypothetical protein V4722_07115 [Bacteroidota bacterium]
MKSRRQFVREGAFAATALLAAQHLKAFAGLTTSFSGNSGPVFSKYTNHLVILHSSVTDNTTKADILNYMKKVQSEAPHTVLLTTGNDMPDAIKVDTSAVAVNSIEQEYKILSKGKIKMGIIYARPSNEDVIKQSEYLANFLKTEKNCQLVVCISQLGHQLKNAPDDLSLANESRNIDIILNGHGSNFSPKTITMPNSLKHEVIIQSSSSSTAPCAKLEIGMDENGNKKLIHLATKLYKGISAA